LQEDLKNPMNHKQANNDKIVIYTTSWCPDCHRAKFLLDEYGIEYVNVDIDNDPEGMAFVKQVNSGYRVIPTIVFPDNSILVDPSNSVLAAKLGIELSSL
jgi:mycoredoxin